MLFCEKCDNMYYLKINEEDSNSLVNYCKQCGYVDTSNTQNIITNIASIEDTNIINEYTKYDCTLPRVNNIPCPNSECNSNKNKEVQPEVILIKSNEKQLTFVYLCCHCDHSWKLN